MRLRVITLLSAIVFLLLMQPASAFADDTTSGPTDSPSATDSPSDGATDAPTDEPTAIEGQSDVPTSVKPESGKYIQVRLVDKGNDKAPVVGVTLTVTDSDGVEIGAAATDADGFVYVPIEGRGKFNVELDTDTLPEGIELDSSTKNPILLEGVLDTNINGLFPIGVQKSDKVPFYDRLTTSVVSGIKFGLLVALAALGLSLIFGTTGLTNFAHGELITFGALVTYMFNVGLGLPVIVAGILAVVVSGGFGWAQDQALWKPLRRRGTGLIAMMIVSIGFGLFLRNLYQYMIGSSRKSLSEYVVQQRRDYWFISLADKELAIILIAIVTITVTCVVLLRTRLGKSMRAVSDNPALAASSGMRVDGVISSVWILGTALTGLSGVLLAVNSQINFLMGFKLLLLVFAGVTLGGLGTIWGALFGSMVIGLMVEVGPLFGVPSSIKEVGALAVLIIVLLVRPQGILGARERVG